MLLNQDFIREASALLGQEQFFVSEPMSKHTTFNIGGPADYLLFPANMEQLSQIFVLLKNYDIPHTILGNGSNVLVLDQPTNHLDLESITAVNNGLVDFKGVVLFASHDHEFVQTIANRIMVLENGHLTDRLGTYEDYIASLVQV